MAEGTITVAGYEQPGGEIEIAPVSCPAPTTDFKRVRRMFPTGDEVRMREEIPHRQMEIFGGKFWWALFLAAQ